MKRKIKGRNYKAPTPRVYRLKETRTTQFIRKQLINKNGAICSLCDKPIKIIIFMLLALSSDSYSSIPA